MPKRTFRTAILAIFLAAFRSFRRLPANLDPSLWVARELSTRLRLAGGLVSQTKTFTSFTNAVELPGFTRLDGAVFYRMKDVTLSLNATNLTNARYYATANGDNNISPGAPRSVQLALRTTF